MAEQDRCDTQSFTNIKDPGRPMSVSDDDDVILGWSGFEGESGLYLPPFSVAAGSLGACDSDMFRGLSDIFENPHHFDVLHDGPTATPTPAQALARPKIGDRVDDEGGKADDGTTPIAEWLSAFGMIAYTDDFLRAGCRTLADLRGFEAATLDRMKLSPHHSALIWERVSRAQKRLQGAAAAASARAHSRGRMASDDEDQVVPSLAKLKLRRGGAPEYRVEGESPAKEGGAETEEAKEDDDHAGSSTVKERSPSDQLNNNVLNARKPHDGDDDDDPRGHFFSQPSELPSATRSHLEGLGPLFHSQPAVGGGEDGRKAESSRLPAGRTRNHASWGLPSRSLGSLSQFLRDQIGSFGLAARSPDGAAGAVNQPSTGRLPPGGVLKVQKYTFRHSFSLSKE